MNLFFNFGFYILKLKELICIKKNSKTPQIFPQKIRGRYIDPWNLKNNCFHKGVVFFGKRWSNNSPPHPAPQQKKLPIKHTRGLLEFGFWGV
jgi:hypothetical protein